MQPLCIKRRAFGDEDYLAIRNEGIDIVRNEGGLIGANKRQALFVYLYFLFTGLMNLTGMSANGAEVLKAQNTGSRS